MFSIAKKFGILALTVLPVTACTTAGGIDMTNAGRVLAPAVGAATGVAITNGSNNPAVRVLGAGVGAAVGAGLSDVFRQPCNRNVQIDNLAGRTTVDRSNCNIVHGAPAGLPPVIYRP